MQSSESKLGLYLWNELKIAFFVGIQQ